MSLFSVWNINIYFTNLIFYKHLYFTIPIIKFIITKNTINTFLFFIFRQSKKGKLFIESFTEMYAVIQRTKYKYICYKLNILQAFIFYTLKNDILLYNFYKFSIFDFKQNKDRALFIKLFLKMYVVIHFIKYKDIFYKHLSFTNSIITFIFTNNSINSFQSSISTKTKLFIELFRKMTYRYSIYKLWMLRNLTVDFIFVILQIFIAIFIWSYFYLVFCVSMCVNYHTNNF